MASKFAVETATAPSHWASYFINGDSSSFEDDSEIAAADNFLKRLGYGTPVSCEDAGFMWRHDAHSEFPLGADCQTYSFLVPYLPFIIRRHYFADLKQWELFAVFPTIAAGSANWYAMDAEAENGDLFSCNSDYWNASRHVRGFDPERVAAFERRVRRKWENDSEFPCILKRYERNQPAFADHRRNEWNKSRKAGLSA